MDTREVAAEYRMAQWAQTIQARVQSGQSIKEYCASAGISRNAVAFVKRHGFLVVDSDGVIA